jgi:HEAT repeat protein
MLVVAGAVGASALGCGRPMPAYPKGFESGDPIVRSRTIQMAAQRGDHGALPLLVNRLEDEDEGVRLFAIVALEKLTGDRLGYNYADPAPQRARAVKRWRAYLESVDKSASRPATGDRRTPR